MSAGVGRGKVCPGPQWASIPVSLRWDDTVSFQVLRDSSGYKLPVNLVKEPKPKHPAVLCAVHECAHLTRVGQRGKETVATCMLPCWVSRSGSGVAASCGTETQYVTQCQS